MMITDSESQRDELIDVVMKVPRTTIVEGLLADIAATKDPDRRRLDVVRTVLAGRRKRKAAFPGAYFGDPSWDMILELYFSTREQRALGVSQLCDLSGTSTTTALRHLENLEARGYLARVNDPGDRRRNIVAILPRLTTALEGWLDAQGAAHRIGR